MKIVLVGFMGTGKTSVGLELARRSGLPFVDTDELIIEREGRSISDIFRRRGEAYFRKVEEEVVSELSKKKGVIVSTGGGVMKSPRNVAALRKNGLLVCLSAEPAKILVRTMKDGKTRPLLDVADPGREVKRLLKERAPLYSLADFSVDTTHLTVGEVSDEIMRKAGLQSKCVGVNLGDRSYDILIGRGLLDALPWRIRALRPSRVAIVSNPTVFDLYGERVASGLREAGMEPLVCLVPDGESSKDLIWLNKILGDLLAAGFDRKGLIVALGGGVIGDLAGFAAAVYMRGIRCVQVPTTLLSQVDSSVGGKTGVNHTLGKNMIGAFFQPSLVVMDTETLETLPRRELLAGFAEIIKYGVIRDAKLFSNLQKNREKILALGRAIEPVIARSCEIKAEVVSKDEREGGLRAILNYGHTVGHAVETVSGYTRYLHGEAVAMGMVAAAEIAVRMKRLSRKDATSIRKLIADYGLPVDLPGDLSVDALCKAMLHDKKAEGGRVRFILPVSIGKVEISGEVTEKVVRKALERLGSG